ncbi:MAG: hypothetical protein NWF00_07400 [Candidatus Bathyarchaeota archaeon]|nr:hypothetical protein [Candidatus Bathyarchaeota archaeon]
MAGGSGYYPSRVVHVVKTDEAGVVQWSIDLPYSTVNQIISTKDGG